MGILQHTSFCVLRITREEEDTLNNNVLGKGTIVPSADDLENPVRNENPALLKHIQNGAKDESEQTKRLRKLHKVLNVHGHLKTVADRNPDSGYFVVAFA